MITFRWSWTVLVVMVVGAQEFTQNLTVSNGPALASLNSSIISVVPIDQITTPASVVMDRGAVQRGDDQHKQNTTERPNFSLPETTLTGLQNETLTPEKVTEEGSIGLRNSSSNSTQLPAEVPQVDPPFSFVQANISKPEARDTTTIFVDGAMLDENGVALESPPEVPSTTTLPPKKLTIFSTETPVTTTESQMLRLKIANSTLDHGSLNTTSNPIPESNLTISKNIPSSNNTSGGKKRVGPCLSSLMNSKPAEDQNQTSSSNSSEPSPTTPEPSTNLPETPSQTKQTHTRSEGPYKPENPSPRQKPETGRRVQLLELQAGVNLIDDDPSGLSKTLKLESLFGDPNRTLELSLSRLDDTQWREDFMQASHYLLGSSDRVGFFKVSLESILSGNARAHHQRRGSLPNGISYHTFMTNYTSLYVSSEVGPSTRDPKTRNSSDTSTAVLLISRLGSYVEVYGLLSDHLMITPVWRHSTTVVDAQDQGLRMRHGAVKRGDKVNQFYTDPRRGALLHGLIDLRGDSLGRHMGFDVGVLMQQIKVHLALANKDTRGTGTLTFGPDGLPYSQEGPQLLPSSNLMSPEVSLFVDHLAYANHGRNVDELWRYLVIYFTRLELIFRQLSNPPVRLRLKDIFIATQPLAFQRAEPVIRNPALTHNRTRPYMNALKAINELGAFFYQEEIRRGGAGSSADLVLVITGADLCGDTADSGWASAGTPNDGCSYAGLRGQSFVGGACRVDRKRGRRLNVAIVEDSGYFDGVLVSAHELGHLLGAVHDGAWPLNGILGPGGRGCSSASGQLMAAAGPGAGGSFAGGTSRKTGSKSAFTWSHCTAEQLAYYARLPAAMCLYNRPPFI